MANIYDMTDTWNDGATTFTGIKMDVTDTASAAGSKLLDLQVGGTPKATIDEGGKLTLTGDIDVGTNKLYYSNVFSTTGDLPSATSYHGMFAHVHAEGAAYFAHGGSWQKLANSGEVGTAGQDGDSAYQVWLDAGNTGSEQDFLDSLVGAAGAPGAAGQDGNDGQQGIQGIQGSAGNDGNDGAQGIQGSPGNDGNDGAQGIQGIQGPAGNDGNDGAQGIQGIQGPAGPATTDIDGTTVDIRKAKIEVPATSVDLGGDARLYSVATTGITLTMDDTALSEGDIVTIYANGFDVTIAQDGTNGFDTVKIDGTTAAHTGNVTVANGTVATISVISTTAGSSFAVITGQGGKLMGVVSSLMSVGAAIKHAVSLATAYLDLDFSSNSYRLADAASSFDAALTGSSPKLTYATTSRSTMTNSAGNIVWAPHNEVKDSEDFGNTSLWLNSLLTGTLVAAASYTDPTGGNNAYLATPVTGTLNMHQNSIRTAVDGGSSGLEYSLSAYFKKPTTNAARYAVLAFSNNSGYNATAHFDLDTVSVSTTGVHPTAGAVNTAKTTIVAVGSGGWYLCTFTVRRDLNLFAAHVNGSTAPGAGLYNRQSTGDGTSGVLVWGAHAYRSDLGGMAPVPGAATGLETYVPTNGAVEHLPSGGPSRLQWVNLGERGLFLESEQRTNLAASSNVFTTAGASTVTANSGVSPTGETNAVLAETVVSSTSAAIFLPAFSAPAINTSITISCYVKDVAGSGILAFFFRSNAHTNQTKVWFNLNTGTKGTQGADGGTISVSDFDIADVGGGWYRLYVVGQDANQTSFNPLIFSAAADNSDTRDANGEVLLFGVQSEAGATPSSYIPTDGSTVIRAAQTLDVPSAELGWDSAGVSFAMEGRMTYTDTGLGSNSNGGDKQFYRMSASSTNYILYGLSTSGSRTGQPAAVQRSSTQGAVSGDLISSAGGNQDYAPGVLVPYNVSARYSTAGVQGANEGTASSFTATPTDTVTLADLSAEPIEFGVKYMGTIRHFRQWDEDIGETGIEEASS